MDPQMEATDQRRAFIHGQSQRLYWLWIGLVVYGMKPPTVLIHFCIICISLTKTWFDKKKKTKTQTNKKNPQLPSFFSFPKLLTISWTTAAPLWGSMPPKTHESRCPPRMTYLSKKHHCKITCHPRSRTEQTANDSVAAKNKAHSEVPEDTCT